MDFDKGVSVRRIRPTERTRNFNGRGSYRLQFRYSLSCISSRPRPLENQDELLFCPGSSIVLLTVELTSSLSFGGHAALRAESNVSKVTIRYNVKRSINSLYFFDRNRLSFEERL